MKNDKVRRNRLLYARVNFVFQMLFDRIISIFSCHFNDRSKLYDILVAILNPEHSFYSLNNLNEKDIIDEFLESATSDSSVVARINKVIPFSILLFCLLFTTDPIEFVGGSLGSDNHNENLSSGFQSYQRLCQKGRIDSHHQTFCQHHISSLSRFHQENSSSLYISIYSLSLFHSFFLLYLM